MAENGWKDAFWVSTRQGVVVGVADASGLDLDQYLTKLWALEINRFDGQGFA